MSGRPSARRWTLIVLLALGAAAAAVPAALVMITATLIATLGEQAPDATIVLVTYPRLVPGADCAAVSMASSEAELVSRLGERLQEAFLSVAAETGIRLADPYSAEGDHGPCAPAGEAWVDGSTAENGFPFHPTADGHAAMAALVEAALT